MEETMSSTTPKRKLIEVALPLEAINRESAREKSIRHGHPSTLHLWWARRPLAAARAVLFAQLVDDPSSRPDEFPTEELQRKERDRLHALIERLVVWENIRDEKLLAEAHDEILKSTNGNPPPILDPFAGGGTIPLEAQRLGLEAHASDLNPVAVLINKALIEIPPKFRDQPPVFPGLADSQFRQWKGAEGLAADVRAYGKWMRDEAASRLNGLYPTINGKTAIAWLWARTVMCPNPACHIETPLVNSFTVCTRKGKEVHVIPAVKDGTVTYSTTRRGQPVAGTVGRSGARCLACDSVIPLNYIREEGRHQRLGRHLLCVVAEDRRRRSYEAPDSIAIDAARAEAPVDFPDIPLPKKALGFRVQAYGLSSQRDFYTPRQQVLLTHLVRLAKEAHNRVLRDCGDPEYANAVVAALALFLGRVANRASSQCLWHPGRETVEQVFARNAMPMIWVYAEANPFSTSTGNVEGQLGYLAEALERVPASGIGIVEQRNAVDIPTGPLIVSTDPPYYDNVPYADLSDFFYLWHREVLKEYMPDVYGTLATPKSEELIAEPARHENASAAAKFFESGLRNVFDGALEAHSASFPMTVYYAFKQSETDEDGTASTGWETMLQALVDVGGQVTATWPVRTELGGGLRELGRNALASSVVLSVRRRPSDESTTDRRGFITSLEAELPDGLRKLQQGSVAPVDLPQAAIGPGMAVFSRYSAVFEDDGSQMSVRSALVRINEVLDRMLDEQEGDFDSTSRFAIAWYRQRGYGIGKFGDADNLARARNTSVEVMDRNGIVSSRAGNVQLIKPADLSSDYDVVADLHTSNWEVLHYLVKVLEHDGISAAGDFLNAALSRPDTVVDADLLKELAHLLFRIAEGNGWTKDALSFNNLVTSWPEILNAARAEKQPATAQSAFEFDDEDN
jgi:putative DNA methylase